MTTWNITYIPYEIVGTNYQGSLLQHAEVKTATISGPDYLSALTAFDPTVEMYVMDCNRVAEETVADYGFADVGGMSYDEVRFASRGE